MTQKQFTTKFNALLPDLIETLAQKGTQAMESGMINLSDAENNYGLPKVVLCGLLASMSAQYMPFTAEGKRIARDIQKYY